MFAGSRPEFDVLPEPVRAQLLTMQFDAQAAQYRAQHPGASEQLIVMESGGTARRVGRCWLALAGNTYRLLDICVLQELRGLGIGTAVIGGLQRQAATEQASLLLSVWQDNVAAVRLYGRLGFTAETEQGGYLRMSWTAVGAGDTTVDR